MGFVIRELQYSCMYERLSFFPHYPGGLSDLPYYDIDMFEFGLITEIGVTYGRL